MTVSCDGLQSHLGETNSHVEATLKGLQANLSHWYPHFLSRSPLSYYAGCYFSIILYHWDIYIQEVWHYMYVSLFLSLGWARWIWAWNKHNNYFARKKLRWWLIKPHFIVPLFHCHLLQHDSGTHSHFPLLPLLTVTVGRAVKEPWCSNAGVLWPKLSFYCPNAKRFRDRFVTIPLFLSHFVRLTLLFALCMSLFIYVADAHP